MKIYRVHHICETGHPDSGHSAGYTYTFNRAEAVAEQRRINKAADIPPGFYEPQEIVIQPTRKGILHALNVWGSHADNG